MSQDKGPWDRIFDIFHPSWFDLLKIISKILNLIELWVKYLYFALKIFWVVRVADELKTFLSDLIDQLEEKRVLFHQLYFIWLVLLGLISWAGFDPHRFFMKKHQFLKDKLSFSIFILFDFILFGPNDYFDSSMAPSHLQFWVFKNRLQLLLELKLEIWWLF